MADFNSIVKGTVNFIGSKAKEISENGTVKDIYDRGSTTARCYANIAKLTVLINGELEEQKKVFTEIGRLYYEEKSGEGEGFYAPLFEQLKSIDKKIEDMRCELEAAKDTVEAAKNDGNGTDSNSESV